MTILLLLSLAGITLIALIAWFVGITLREMRDTLESLHAEVTLLRDTTDICCERLTGTDKSLKGINAIMQGAPTNDQIRKIVDLYKLWYVGDNQENCLSFIRERL